MIFVILLFLSPALFANEEKTLIKVGYVSFPPYEFTENNEPEGIFIRLLKEVLANTEYRARFTELPVSRLYLYLQEGTIDLWPGVKGIPVLQPYVLESEATPIRINLGLFSYHEKDRIAGLESIRNKRLLLINGYTYGGLLYKLANPDMGYRIAFAPGTESALLMLMKNRGDYLLDYLEPVTTMTTKNSLELPHFHPLTQQEGAFVVSRKSKNPEKLLADLTRSYHELSARLGEQLPTIDTGSK